MHSFVTPVCKKHVALQQQQHTPVTHCINVPALPHLSPHSAMKMSVATWKNDFIDGDRDMRPLVSACINKSMGQCCSGHCKRR